MRPSPLWNMCTFRLTLKSAPNPTLMSDNNLQSTTYHPTSMQKVGFQKLTCGMLWCWCRICQRPNTALPLARMLIFQGQVQKCGQIIILIINLFILIIILSYKLGIFKTFKVVKFLKKSHYGLWLAKYSNNLPASIKWTIRYIHNI